MDTPHAMPGRTALVCVEDAMSVVMLFHALSAQGVGVVRIALSGRSALAIVRAARPDIVLIDGDMPDMSGVEVAQAISGEDPCRIVMLLPEGGPEPPAEAIGVAEVIRRPFTLDDLTAAIARVLEKPSH